MRSARAASAAALLGITALGIAVPAAFADDDITSFGFNAFPAAVAPGGMVTLKAAGCEAPLVTVSSAVFDTVILKEGMSAAVKVDADARPGTIYTVTFDCNGRKGTTNVTIIGAAPPPSRLPASPSHPAAPPATRPAPAAHPPHSAHSAARPTQTHSSSMSLRPDKGTHGGLGGSIAFADTTKTAIGGALLLAGAGGVLLMCRHAHRRSA